MKLMRFGLKGQEKPGVIIDGKTYDCSLLVDDWDGDTLSSIDKADILQQATSGKLVQIGDTVRRGPCIARPPKLIGVGLNYLDHAQELSLTPPDEPLIFLKANNITAGAFDDLYLPPHAKQVDWEVELGIVIGQDAFNLDNLVAAQEAILGYTIVNDITDRHWQFDRQGQWTKGKSYPGFCTVGPWMSFKEDIQVDNLGLSLAVNNQPKQNSNTKQLIFTPVQLVHYISQYMALEPGDLICTGTPGGIGYSSTPQQFLHAGDIIIASIEQLGQQEQRCYS
ncbi:fumarylacetoacetate hydrolase family protein [Shewanella surugensis]|uniref:Fumarylacetoacetate hydrolase family protein n=1 Tax=Shewanella surugensis TaxID=212020 RepID=A0ABT0LE09_9GAMM|nr:fumarylacetoacetate hydrolase family protein [Shewanella surugensis]MCL1125944.1 fumarylacetoacetate hydrolase family protein [Shewanella surugensis]